MVDYQLNKVLAKWREEHNSPETTKSDGTYYELYLPGMVKNMPWHDFNHPCNQCANKNNGFCHCILPSQYNGHSCLS